MPHTIETLINSEKPFGHPYFKHGFPKERIMDYYNSINANNDPEIKFVHLKCIYSSAQQEVRTKFEPLFVTMLSDAFLKEHPMHQLQLITAFFRGTCSAKYSKKDVFINAIHLSFENFIHEDPRLGFRVEIKDRLIKALELSRQVQIANKSVIEKLANLKTSDVLKTIYKEALETYSPREKKKKASNPFEAADFSAKRNHSSRKNNARKRIRNDEQEQLSIPESSSNQNSSASSIELPNNNAITSDQPILQSLTDITPNPNKSIKLIDSPPLDPDIEIVPVTFDGSELFSSNSTEGMDLFTLFKGDKIDKGQNPSSDTSGHRLFSKSLDTTDNQSDITISHHPLAQHKN